MAGSFELDHVHRPPVRIWNLRWTSHTNGKVSGDTFVPTPGQVVRVDFVPAEGDAKPLDNYDCQLVQAMPLVGQELDLLYGEGMNLSNDTPSTIVPTPDTTQPTYLDGEPVELKIDDAGSQNEGLVRIICV